MPQKVETRESSKRKVLPKKMDVQSLGCRSPRGLSLIKVASCLQIPHEISNEFVILLWCSMTPLSLSNTTQDHHDGSSRLNHCGHHLSCNLHN